QRLPDPLHTGPGLRSDNLLKITLPGIPNHPHVSANCCTETRFNRFSLETVIRRPLTRSLRPFCSWPEAFATSGRVNSARRESFSRSSFVRKSGVPRSLYWLLPNGFFLASSIS